MKKRLILVCMIISFSIPFFLQSQKVSAVDQSFATVEQRDQEQWLSKRALNALSEQNSENDGSLRINYQLKLYTNNQSAPIEPFDIKQYLTAADNYSVVVVFTQYNDQSFVQIAATHNLAEQFTEKVINLLQSKYLKEFNDAEDENDKTLAVKELIAEIDYVIASDTYFLAKDNYRNIGDISQATREAYLPEVKAAREAQEQAELERTQEEKLAKEKRDKSVKEAYESYYAVAIFMTGLMCSVVFGIGYYFLKREKRLKSKQVNVDLTIFYDNFINFFKKKK